jgi:hypothetical protein
VAKQPKVALKNQKHLSASADSTSPADAVEAAVPAASDASGSGEEAKAGGQSGQGFSPLDLLRCLEDPFPGNRPVRVSSLASLRGRS